MLKKRNFFTKLILMGAQLNFQLRIGMVRKVEILKDGESSEEPVPLEKMQIAFCAYHFGKN